MLNLLIGMMLGFSLAVPPGPMNALIAAESLRSPIHGTMVGAGAMTADAILMTISLLLYQLVKPFVYYIYLAGGIIMIYLAYNVLMSKQTGSNNKAVTISYTKGIIMGITNPYQISWWVTAGLSFISIFGLESVLGLFIAIIIWIIVFPIIINLGSRYGGSKAYDVIRVTTAAAIVGFGLYFIINGLTQLHLISL